MTHHRIAALLAAAAIAVPAVPALAQTADQPAAASTAPPKAAAPKAAAPKKAHKRAAAKASPRPAAAAVPPIVASPLGADGDPSLERRRRAFFGSKPDAGGPSAPDAPVGVTLGGSNGLTPGMGMKF